MECSLNLGCEGLRILQEIVFHNGQTLRGSDHAVRGHAKPLHWEDCGVRDEVRRYEVCYGVGNVKLREASAFMNTFHSQLGARLRGGGHTSHRKTSCLLNLGVRTRSGVQRIVRRLVLSHAGLPKPRWVGWHELGPQNLEGKILKGLLQGHLHSLESSRPPWTT